MVVFEFVLEVFCSLEDVVVFVDVFVYDEYFVVEVYFGVEIVLYCLYDGEVLIVYFLRNFLLLNFLWSVLNFLYCV